MFLPPSPVHTTDFENSYFILMLKTIKKCDFLFRLKFGLSTINLVKRSWAFFDLHLLFEILLKKINQTCIRLILIDLILSKNDGLYEFIKYETINIEPYVLTGNWRLDFFLFLLIGVNWKSVSLILKTRETTVSQNSKESVRHFSQASGHILYPKWYKIKSGSLSFFVLINLTFQHPFL